MTCLLADDEAPARVLLSGLLADHPQLELLTQAHDGAEAMAALERLRPELVFLDIHMPGLDGLRVVRGLPRGYEPLVVFVTAHACHAVDAFEVHALDYLLKPLTPAAVERAVARAIAARASFDVGHAAPPPASPPLERVALRDGERVILQRVREIERFEAEGKYIHAHVPGRPPRRMRQTMHGLSARLDPHAFIRVNRSVIINLDHVQEIQPWIHGEWLLIMGSGAQVTTTRSFRQPLDALLGRTRKAGKQLG